MVVGFAVLSFVTVRNVYVDAEVTKVL